MTRLSRPGWIDGGRTPAASRSRGRGGPPRGQGAHRPTYHGCYRRRHPVPEDILPARDFQRIVWSYENLTPEKKSRVPATSYWRAKAQFADDGRMVDAPHTVAFQQRERQPALPRPDSLRPNPPADVARHVPREDQPPKPNVSSEN